MFLWWCDVFLLFFMQNRRNSHNPIGITGHSMLHFEMQYDIGYVVVLALNVFTYITYEPDGNLFGTI